MDDGEETQDPVLLGEFVEWQTYQHPSIEEHAQEASITKTPPPGTAAGRPDSEVHRFELDPRARFTSGGKATPRAEVYGRHAVPGSTEASKWPDPVGSTRWYTFSLYVPPGFQTSSGTNWIVLTQWKGYKGGSPPLSIEIKRENLRLGGTRTNSGLIGNDGNLGPLVQGVWTTLVVGIKFSTSADEGWVEVIRDGKTVVPQTPVAAMDVIDGKPDPTYFKQGIYQDTSWSATHVLYASAVTISTDRPSY